MTMVSLVGHNITEEAKLNLTVDLINLFRKYDVREKIYLFKKLPSKIIHQQLQTLEEIESFLDYVKVQE